MSDYISAFDWEINFVSHQEHSLEPDWTPSYEEFMGTPKQPFWGQFGWPNEGSQRNNLVVQSDIGQTCDAYQEGSPSSSTLTSYDNNTSSLAIVTADLLASSDETPAWTCNVNGCGSKTFGRRTELLRHQKKHNVSRDFACVAQHCRRTGQHGFTRKDKLIDHMLAGHDEEAVFACPHQGCVIRLTRDMLSIHAQQDTPATRLGLYRVCPMPRCSFRIHAWRTPLDTLRTHIIQQRDKEGRKAFAGLLRNRGYEPVAVDIMCPLCAYTSESHADFQVHLLTVHGEMSIEEIDSLGWTGGNLQSPSLVVQHKLSAISLIYRERRVILSLWPQFETCPVWEDMKCQFQITDSI